MQFVTLADRSGLAECVLFPDAHRRLGAAMRGEVVRVGGLVEETLGALTVSVRRARGYATPERAREVAAAGNHVAARGA
jgi:hypothetical protein